MGKEIADGQISIFDILSSADRDVITVPPILLTEGEVVYKVIKGDVEKYKVTNEKSWLIGTNNRRYRLIDNMGQYNDTTNISLGVDCFKDKYSAEKAASQYINSHDVICAEDIHPVRVIAYTYVCEIDKHTMTSFYADLGNGMLYMKYFTQYHHMEKNTPKNIKQFMQQPELSKPGVHKMEFIPKFKNMYRCKGAGKTWIYAEARYDLAIG